MSIIVKGMKMPENCIKCPLQFGGWCYASPTEIDERVAPTVDEAWEQVKPDWCPLVALPDKHGRLVDADALRDRLRSLADDDWNANTTTTWSEAFSECDDMVDDASTIVESEDGT